MGKIGGKTGGRRLGTPNKVTQSIRTLLNTIPSARGTREALALLSEAQRHRDPLRSVQARAAVHVRQAVASAARAGRRATTARGTTVRSERDPDTACPNPPQLISTSAGSTRRSRIAFRRSISITRSLTRWATSSSSTIYRARSVQTTVASMAGGFVTHCSIPTAWRCSTIVRT